MLCPFIRINNQLQNNRNTESTTKAIHYQNQEIISFPAFLALYAEFYAYVTKNFNYFITKFEYVNIILLIIIPSNRI